jgi:hypothetical protein
MTMAAAASHTSAIAREEDRAEAILAALARLPVGRPLTPHETKRIADGEAYVAAGGKGHSTEEVIAAARARYFL